MGKTYSNLLKMKYNLVSPISINQLDISSQKPTSWVLKCSASFAGAIPIRPAQHPRTIENSEGGADGAKIVISPCLEGG